MANVLGITIELFYLLKSEMSIFEPLHILLKHIILTGQYPTTAIILGVL